MHQDPLSEYQHEPSQMGMFLSGLKRLSNG
jgi:hypothetical protein